MIHDDNSNELYILDTIESAEMNSEKILVRNSVLDEANLSVDIEKAKKLLNFLLNQQREVFEKIKDSVGKVQLIKTKTFISTSK